MSRLAMARSCVGTGLADQPKCWVIPSAVVACVLTTSHRNWLAAPGKKGQPHKDGPMRRMLPDYSRHGMKDHGLGWLDGYLDAWRLIAPPAV